MHIAFQNDFPSGIRSARNKKPVDYLRAPTNSLPAQLPSSPRLVPPKYGICSPPPTFGFERMRMCIAYVPDLVVQRVAANPGAPAAAYEEAFPAALLFVDIVGYVRLTGVAQRGIAQRERRGDAMEQMQNMGAQDNLQMDVAGLTGKGGTRERKSKRRCVVRRVFQTERLSTAHLEDRKERGKCECVTLFR